MKTSSRIISWVFVPLLTPLYGLMAALFIPSAQDFLEMGRDCLYDEPMTRKWGLVYFFFFFGTVVPAIAFAFLKFSGLISTIEIDDRKERGLPIIIMLVSCVLLFASALYGTRDNVNDSKFILSYPLAGIISTGIFFIMTLWKKVSLHAGGVGIMTGYIIAYLAVHVEFAAWLVPASVLVSGLVMSARVYLEKHTLQEVFIGWTTGAVVSFLVNYLY